MATAQNINRLTIAIDNLWNMELRDYDVEKSFQLRMIYMSLEQVKKELIEEREKRLAVMGYIFRKDRVE